MLHRSPAVLLIRATETLDKRVVRRVHNAVTESGLQDLGERDVGPDRLRKLPYSVVELIGLALGRRRCRNIGNTILFNVNKLQEWLQAHEKPSPTNPTYVERTR